MSKNLQSAPIILNTLKMKSPYICPNCGENHYAYVSKKRKTKGIYFYKYRYEGFFKDRYGKSYLCNTCGYKWDIRN